MTEKKIEPGEMSRRVAERIVETYENGSKNGMEWMHDVVLHRGTDKYQKNIDQLNEALRIKSIPIVIEPMESTGEMIPVSRRRRR